MKTFAAAIIASTALAGRYVSPEFPGYIRNPNRAPEKITEVTERLETLPDQVLWNNFEGKNYLTNVWN